MLTASCDFDYIYEPVTPYRQSVFDWINRWMPEKASVLDLGCGAVGFYWALRYLDNVSAISFADRNEDVIALLSSRIDSLTPSSVRAQFGDMTDDAQGWLEDFHGKIESILVVDALADRPQKEYEAVIAIELLDCANSDEELSAMLHYCRNSLKLGGRLIGCALHYQDWTDSLEELSKDALAGKLNSNANSLKSALADANLTIEGFDIRDPGMKNYPQAYFFCASRKA